MNLLDELGSKDEEVITLLVDNVSAINLARNPIAHGKRKHIEIHFHYLREPVCASQLKLGKCRSKEQLVDLLTKGVTNDVFKKLVRSLGMKDVEHFN